MSDEKKSKSEYAQMAKEQEESVLDAIKKVKVDDLLSKSYTEIDSYVDMVAFGISNGCIIEGKGGVGKTWRVLNRLNTKGKDFAFFNSYTTPLAFYSFLYKNKDRDVLVIDDVAKLFTDNTLLNFLKNALWDSVNEKRIVNYGTSKPISDDEVGVIPRMFELNAKIIIIANYINQKNPDVKAVLSRVNHCRVEIKKDELIKILEQVAKKNYDGLSEIERMEVFNYLKRKSDETLIDLNIRTLIRAFQFKRFSKQVKNDELWTVLLSKNLKVDDRAEIVKTLVADKSFASEEDRAKKFEDLTGLGRATYFNLKKKFEI